MRKSVLFVLLMTTILLAACGGDNEENSNTPVDNIDNDINDEEDASDNDTNDDEDNNDSGMNDNENHGNEFALVDVSLDISESITEAYDFFDDLYFSDAEIINEEIGLKSADVTVYVDDQSQNNIARFSAHTIEPENSFHLSVDLNPEDFEDNLTNTDADGNKMAEEVADGAYEYAEELIWKKDGHVYQLDGGRSVVSTNKENEIHPEEDRLLFYENLVPTDGELKTYDEFYQNVMVPTQLPEGFTLDRVTLFYDQPLGFSKRPPARLLYEAKGTNNESITFLVYGEYEEAPTLKGDNIREEDILQTPVQVDEEKLLFTLNDETYEIDYLGVPEEVVLEIAASIIEQADS